MLELWWQTWWYSKTEFSVVALPSQCITHSSGSSPICKTQEKNSYFEPRRSSRNSLAQIATLHPPLTCIWYDSVSYQGPFSKNLIYIYPLPISAQFMGVCLFISRIYLGFTAALTASNWIKPLPKYYFVSNCCMNKVLIENITQIPSRKIPDLEILQKSHPLLKLLIPLVQISSVGRGWTNLKVGERRERK